jgi:NADH dehydrogenase [ubiquinone] 1 alpha subcomplex assembly factor 5
MLYPMCRKVVFISITVCNSLPQFLLGSSRLLKLFQSLLLPETSALRFVMRLSRPISRVIKRPTYLVVSSRSESNLIFDRELKARQKERSLLLTDGEYYDYLREESAARIVDRIEDISRVFPTGLELGCHRGALYDLINGTESLRDGGGGIGGIKTLYQCDMALSAMRTNTKEDTQAPLVDAKYLHGDEENGLPFQEGSFDIVLSSMNLHWINDLQKVLKSIKTVLKPDGVFIGSMLGGSTLQELKECLYLAEQERKGGFSPHASPLAKPSDIAGLMQANFSLPTIDIDTHTISYPDAFTLMEHLGLMGEGHATVNRRYSVGRDTFLAAAALYQEKYGLEDGSIPATFQIIYMIGWKPHASQPKAMPRGSGTHKLTDLNAVKLDKPYKS